VTSQPASRRDELLHLAASMFAERGLRATTVRDIADRAGILSGSLYHHFASKEEMVDEVLRDFLDWLFARYQHIIDTEPNPLDRLKGLFMASFDAIEDRHAQVTIYQDEAQRLLSQPRFGYLEELNRRQRQMWVDVIQEGIVAGCFRSDLDVDLMYRFIRDTTWVSVRWYRPGGPLTAEQVGQQYLSIVLGGITADEPLARREKCADEPLARREKLADKPLARREKLADEPLARREKLADEPLARREVLSEAEAGK